MFSNITTTVHNPLDTSFTQCSFTLRTRLGQSKVRSSDINGRSHQVTWRDSSCRSNFCVNRNTASRNDVTRKIAVKIDTAPQYSSGLVHNGAMPLTATRHLGHFFCNSNPRNITIGCTAVHRNNVHFIHLRLWSRRESNPRLETLSTSFLQHRCRSIAS